MNAFDLFQYMPAVCDAENAIYACTPNKAVHHAITCTEDGFA